jgi:hypothetical protein
MQLFRLKAVVPDRQARIGFVGAGYGHQHW